MMISPYVRSGVTALIDILSLCKSNSAYPLKIADCLPCLTSCVTWSSPHTQRKFQLQKERCLKIETMNLEIGIKHHQYYPQNPGVYSLIEDKRYRHTTPSHPSTQPNPQETPETRGPQEPPQSILYPPPPKPL